MSKTAHNTPKIALALSTALVSVALAGCTTSAAPPASASLAKAQAAIEKGKAGKAVEHAEAAVLADPRNASNRALLGAAYLEAGRFQAAATSFGDALALGDTDNRTVLSYALAQTAQGNNAEAIRILDQYEGQLDHADRGLALALAGEPRDGVRSVIMRFKEFLGAMNRILKPKIGFDENLSSNTEKLALNALMDICLPIMNFARSPELKVMDPDGHIQEMLEMKVQEFEFNAELLKRFVAVNQPKQEADALERRSTHLLT